MENTSLMEVSSQHEISEGLTCMMSLNLFRTFLTFFHCGGKKDRGRTGNREMNYFGNDKWKSTGKLSQEEENAEREDDDDRAPEEISLEGQDCATHGS